MTAKMVNKIPVETASLVIRGSLMCIIIRGGRYKLRIGEKAYYLGAL